MRTPPGQLPSNEVDALIAPYEEFEAFGADLAVIRVVTELTELTYEGHTLRAFNCIHTMGSGGGLGYGESGIAVLAAELRGAPRAPTRVKRKRLGARIRHLLTTKVNVPADAAFDGGYFVLSEDPDGARTALPEEALAYLGRRQPDVDLELRRHHFVAHRRGSLAGEAQAEFVRELAPLVPLLSRPGYRG